MQITLDLAGSRDELTLAATLVHAALQKCLPPEQRTVYGAASVATGAGIEVDGHVYDELRRLNAEMKAQIAAFADRPDVGADEPTHTARVTAIDTAGASASSVAPLDLRAAFGGGASAPILDMAGKVVGTATITGDTINTKITDQATQVVVAQSLAQGSSIGFSPSPLADRDADGIPWDARIHAGSKTRNADGTWRTRRNTDPALVASITAELKAAVAAPPAPPPVPAVPAVPPVPGAAAAAAATLDTPHTALILDISKARNSGKLVEADVIAALATVGLTSLAQLPARPDLCPAVREALVAAGKL